MSLAYLGLRESLVARFGGSAENLAEEEERWVESVGGSIENISPYRYMSKVFFDGLLAPALDRNDIPEIEECSSFLEEVFESGDPDLLECATIRVSTMVLSRERWKFLVKSHGGPLWRQNIAELTGDPTWIH